MKNRLLITGLLLNSALYSQIAVTNKGILYIKTNSDVFYAAGSFNNTSSAVFTNNGSLYIKGDISNNQSSMSAGIGTVYLNGTSLQTISGTQTFNVYNLNTNNTAGIQLNNDLSVGGVHTFSSGLITTSSTPNYVIYQPGASYVGGSDAKHINGWVKKIGNTNFTFPTGNGTYLRPLTIQNLASSSEFDVRYSGPTYNASNVLWPIASMNPAEHWTVNQISGSSAQVQLNWDSSQVPFPNYVVPDLRATVYSGGQWTNAGGTATGSVATTGVITSNSISSFGRMAIGSVSYPLPLQFVSVSALRENASVRIKWQTANEVRVLNYDVQRSVNGKDFYTIGTVSALNGYIQTYQSLDLNVPSSKLFYRIMSRDIDGRTRYSGIVIITPDNLQKIQLLINPVNEVIQLVTQNIPYSTYSYQLVNAGGQVCKKGSFTCEGSSSVAIPVNNISKGQYTLMISKPGEERKFKILIQ